MADLFWPSMILLAAGTFLLRYSFIYLMDKVEMPDSVQRLLRFIPMSVLPAIIVPAVAIKSAAGIYTLDFHRITAALAAFLIALKTKNMPLTIAAGMFTLWLLKIIWP